MLSVKTQAEYTQALSASDVPSVVVLFFAAAFHPACASGGQLDQVCTHLASAHQREARFVRVDAEAEELAGVAEQMGVALVPTIVFLVGGRKVDVLEGANPPELVSRLEKCIHLAAAAAQSSSSSSTTTATTMKKKEESTAATVAVTVTTPFVLTDALRERLHRLIHTSRIMVFIKGTPQAVKCKFSKRLVELLAQQSIQYASFDILTDNDVREGLKIYSDWKTFPQLYVDGKLIGGTDIVEEMIKDGSFKEVIEKEAEKVLLPTSSESGKGSSKNSLEDRLRSLVTMDRVVLFMKGSPKAPRCGFSAKIVKILDDTGVKYASFDVLEDNAVREGIKVFSNFPTFPQLYVKGQLIGGLDIVQELLNEGELEGALNSS